MFEMQHIYTVAVMALVFAPLELLLPARKAPRPTLGRYRTDLLHAAIGGFLIRIGTVIVLGLVVPIGIGPDWIATSPLWLQFIAVLLISDLMFWIAHRLYHAVPLLWRFHRIHHSSEHLDWLAAFRVHPVDQIVNASLIAAPTLMLGFSPAALLIYITIYKWHAILLHSNLKIGFGPLNWLIITPGFHHWHHANQEEAFDRNFGGQLTIWDRMFGTYHAAAQPRPDVYGVENPPPESFIAQLLEPFMPGPKNG